MAADARTELAQIAKRIDNRAGLERKDRERQRALMRQLIGEGHTWDEVQSAARVSRTTLRDALRSS